MLAPGRQSNWAPQKGREQAEPRPRRNECEMSAWDGATGIRMHWDVDGREKKQDDNCGGRVICAGQRTEWKLCFFSFFCLKWATLTDKHWHDFQVIESIPTLSGRGNHKNRLNLSSNWSSDGSETVCGFASEKFCNLNLGESKKILKWKSAKHFSSK